MADSFDVHFTERAREVLILAQEEAARMNQNHIGTEHLLVGLVREGNGVAARALQDFGVELSQVRERIKVRVRRSQRTLLESRTGPTPRTKRVIERAVEEARRMHHPWIGTGHLLLGLIREGEGLAVEVLRDLGVGLTALRTQLIRMVPEEPEKQPILRCTTCDRPLQGDWRFCPFCGAPAPGRCPHCHELLPDEERIRFCPHCGGQV